MKFSLSLAALAASLAFAGPALAAPPSYAIVDLGVPSPNVQSAGWGISSSGAYITGRGTGSGTLKANAFVWSAGSLAKLNPYSDGTGALFNNWGYAVNDSGLVVGNVSTSAAATSEGTAYATNAAVVWKNGAASVLNATGRVFDVNNAGIAVGSVGGVGAISQRAAIYNTNTLGTTFITAQTSDGISMKSATGINNGGLVIGTGMLTNPADGTNVAPVGLLYDMTTSSMTRIATGASATASVTAAAINGSGSVVGSLNATPQFANTARPYVWSAADGFSSVALPTGMVGGTATGINDLGWIVGNARNNTDPTNHPFITIAGASYLLTDLISDATGWNFASFSNIGISGIGNDGTISGYTAYNGTLHGFALQLTAVPEPSSYALMLAGLLAVGSIARRRNPR